MDNLKNLPTRWIKTDIGGNIIDEFCKRGIPEGHRHWLLVKAHYRNSKNGPEYYTGKLGYLAEAIRVREDPEVPGMECVSRRWVYGVRVPLTSEVKSEELGPVQTYADVMS